MHRATSLRLLLLIVICSTTVANGQDLAPEVDAESRTALKRWLSSNEHAKLAKVEHRKRVTEAKIQLKKLKQRRASDAKTREAHQKEVADFAAKLKEFERSSPGPVPPWFAMNGSQIGDYGRFNHSIRVVQILGPEEMVVEHRRVNMSYSTGGGGSSNPGTSFNGNLIGDAGRRQPQQRVIISGLSTDEFIRAHENGTAVSLNVILRRVGGASRQTVGAGVTTVMKYEFVEYPEFKKIADEALQPGQN